jgi:phospholipid transport system substrate-binding protein
MKKLFIAFICLISFSASSITDVDKKDPYKLVQVVADDLFQRIANEQAKIQEDPENLRVVVSEQLAPYINYKYAAATVLGTHYRKTKKPQRDAFFAAFKEYLVATYAGILTLYKDQQVVFEPASKIEGKKTVQVNVRVLDEGKPDINIGFKLRKNKQGEWAAYDMVAEGISVLKSKRSELQGLIRQQGVDSVTKLLLDKAAKPIVVKKIGS